MAKLQNERKNKESYPNFPKKELSLLILYFLIFLQFLKTLKLEEMTLGNIYKIMPLKMIFLSIPSEC